MIKFFRKLKTETNEKGAFAVILAAALIPLIMSVGAAVDLSRAYVVRSRIAFALDAAGLAVGASYSDDETELQNILETYFEKNYPDAAMGERVSLTMTIEESLIRVSATYNLPTTFMAIANIDNIEISVSSELIRETKGLEVALVLDNTGSMASSGKIGALRTAAADLINILFGTQAEPDFLKVSLVPYVTTVNIGRNNKAYVDFSGSLFTGNDTTDQTKYNTVWKGCVMARDYPYNVQSGLTGGLWKPYVWTMEPYYRYSSGTTGSGCANRSNTAGTKWYSVSESSSDTSGPNKSCPNALTPLTNVKQDLLNKIAALIPWSNSGTMSHMGIVWGTETLTPDPPFAEGVDFEDPEWNKAMVIMTDGINELVQQNSTCAESATKRPVATLWPSGGPYTNFSGEGFPVDDGRLPLGTGTDSSKFNNMKTLMNTYTAEACEYAKSLGIIVYTITFQLSNTTIQNLYRNCATDSSKYYNSPTNADLQRAFRAIGAELSNLRVSK